MVLNYEKQHKEGTCKVLGRSFVFSAFYADFCLCPKLVIITTLIVLFKIVCRSWVRYPVWPHTFVSPSAFSRRAVVSYWRKYVHEVLVNRLGGLSLPRKSVVRLTDRPDMTLDVYRGRKTTNQSINQNSL